MSKAKSPKKNRRARRHFTAEFKAEVVRLCREGGESIGAVSKRLADLADELAAVSQVGGDGV